MITNMPWNGGTDEEYETQHFGFGSQRLKIAVRLMVEQKITNGLKDMASYLQESLDLNDTDKVTLTKSCDKLVQLYCDRAGPSLSVVDNEIERMMKIPSNVLLPGDECQNEQILDEEYEKLKQEVADLRKQIERGALMEALLTAEEEESSALDNVCEMAKKDMEIFDIVSKNSGSGCKSAINETMFLCASVNFMKETNFDVFN